MIEAHPGDQNQATAPSASRTLDHTRIIPALIFVPLFYILVRHVAPAALFLLVLAVAGLAFREFILLVSGASVERCTLYAGWGAIVMVLMSLQWPELLSIQIALLLGVIAIVSANLLLSARPASETALPAMAGGFGLLYIGFTLGHVLSIRLLAEGEWLVFFLIFVTWAGDTGAYYAGKLWGKRLLAPALSPKKTVEGLAGGLLLATACAGIAHFWFLPILPLTDCLLNGVLLTLAGLVGDLSESMFKRYAGVKDSGNLIPGHGGFLDRIDSLLLTAPTFYYYMALVKG